MIKRIGLFLLLNFLVVITISVVLHLLGVQPYLTQHGLSYNDLALFCLVWGMGGAVISLLLSRWMAKTLLNIRVNDPRLTSYRPLLERLARDAGLYTTPEFGLFESSELNAFATGPTKARSLVAVSSALLETMDADELEGVLAHEIAHIANGDMVTMTLIQGVVNAFVMFLARALAFALSRRDRRGTSYALVYLFEIVFMLLGSIVVAFFSRQREFRADRGGADLATPKRMIAALQCLSRSLPGKKHPSIQTLMINGGGIWSLFNTHPPLEERIRRLRS